MATCRDCISTGGGCCVGVFEDGWKLVLLPSEVKKISAITGKAPSEFADMSPLSARQLDWYTNGFAGEDPLWARLFQLWKRPSAIRSKCPFLTPSGCSLPYDSKPFLCRIYPLGFNITTNKFYYPPETDCIVERDLHSASEVLDHFHDDESHLGKSFQTFRRQCLELLEKHERMNIRAMAHDDKAVIMDIIRRTPEFSQDDEAVAEEVIDAYLDKGFASDYHTYVVEVSSEVAGYICFGPTPITQGTWDIYWLAVDPKAKGAGLGSALIAFAEDQIQSAQGRMAIIETSSGPVYENTRQFHLAHGYTTVGTIPDYYSPGDDKLILVKRF